MTSTFFSSFKYPFVRLAGLGRPALTSPQYLPQRLLPYLTAEGAADARGGSRAVGGAMAIKGVAPGGAAIGCSPAEGGGASAWWGRERAAR